MSGKFPIPGDRVGFVCGPCQQPEEDSGIVLAVYSNRWSQNNALILMNNGRIHYTSSRFTNVGIGMYLLQPAPIKTQH